MQIGMLRLYPAVSGRCLWLLHNETGRKDSRGMPDGLQGLHGHRGVLCKAPRSPLRARVQVM